MMGDIVMDKDELKDDEEDTEDAAITSDDDDEDGDDSDYDIDAMVSKIDSQNDLARKREIRRRLEEIQEQRLAMRDLDSTYNFNLDDDF